jgi:hypothetical protein
MSIVPELVLQTSISRGIQAFRNDSRLIDQLFRNLSQGDQEQMREFIKHNQLEMSINYPRSQLRLPAVVIMLRSDNEHAEGAYLDDFMGIGTPDEFSYTGGIEDQILGGTASVSTISGQGNVVFGPHYVLSATLNTISVTNRAFYVNQFMDGVDRLTVHIVDGTGAGQQREIVANSSSNLMVDTNWTTVPDSTSVFEIRGAEVEVLGQPSMLYDSRNSTEIIERKGGLYTNKYQIQVVAAKQEQVIYLYAILKSIFTMGRIFMEGQGVINFRMSGTDFASRPEYIPYLAYNRFLNIEFESPFDIFVPAADLIESFTLCLTEGIEGTDAQISTDPVDISAVTPAITGP